MARAISRARSGMLLWTLQVSLPARRIPSHGAPDVRPGATRAMDSQFQGRGGLPLVAESQRVAPP